MWFDQLMESCKTATRVLWTRPGMLLPWLLANIALGGASVILVILGAVMIIPMFLFSQGDFLFLLGGMLLVGTIIALLISLLWSAFSAGFTAMLLGALAGEASLSDGFWRGVRQWTFKLWSANLLLMLILFLASPLLVMVFVLTAGLSLLSGGVALVAVHLLWFVFLTALPIAVVTGDQGGIAPLLKSIRMGRERFGLMLLLSVAAASLPMMASYLGLLGFLLAGWLVGIAVATWLRLVVIQEYWLWQNQPDSSQA